MNTLYTKITHIGMVAMMVLGLSAAAAAAPVGVTGSGNFNHMTTGFPLSGGHATAVCETCHVGGVFKGTPRNCDGCHAVGKRVVATPKSNSHIVTDAPCESCHFNTATFLGARFNHASAQPEQCKTCHNGRIAVGKPASHSSGGKATDSCDHCHRISAFLPASWNHVGVVPGTCTTCHGVNAIGKPSSHNTVAKATYQCDQCHSFIGWLPAKYKHNTSGACANCHNGSIAIGKTSTHTGAKGTLACDDCHKISGWLPAAYTHRAVAPGTCATCHNGSSATGKTTSHNGLMGTLACDSCHRTTSWLPASYNHQGAGACSTCHNGTSAVGKGAGHTATTAECNQCHTSTTTWLGALGGMPSNHIPFNAGTTCSSCHVNGAVVTGAILHAHVSATCKTCHNSSPVYLGNMTRKTIGNHEGSNTGQDCTSCHARQFNLWNEP